MGGIIWLLLIVWIIVKVAKANEAAKKGNPVGQQLQRQLQQQIQKPQNSKPQYANLQGEQRPVSGQTRRTVTEEDRAKLENYRKKKNGGAYVPSQPVQSNQELDVNRQRTKQQPDIVERAKANSKKYASKDDTLEAMETEHNHTERVSSAVAGYVEEEREKHRKMHEEPRPRVEDESRLGAVEDLMVKGYDENLSFERDFVGEATDFLAKLTL